MKSLPDTVKEYSVYAAQKFLQTAVLIDDRIYEPKVGFVTDRRKEVAAPRQRKKVIKSAEGKSPDEVLIADNTQEADEFSSYDVVTSFAKKQIICSLYQPKKSATVSPTSDIFPLCLAADIVIVDWDLYGDRGQRALDLIGGLIKKATTDVPEQLRLILVYTQEINLFDISNQLYQKVNESLGESMVLPLEDCGLAFHTNNSRVSVFGKAGRSRPNINQDHIVQEKNLADVSVKEFAKLASGLLHAMTLLGLAEIKNNSRKVLSKFDEDLDPAFLTHLAMRKPEEEASRNIIPLLVSEIESVLEDALPTSLVSEQLIQDWCQNVWTPGEHLDEILGQGDPDTISIAEIICLEGFKAAKEKYDSIPNPKNNVRKAAKVLLPSSASDANHRFSHLMSSRTFYGDKQKTLKLGAIVYDQEESRYLLCIQPVCDSVRLQEDTVFVFVQLTIIDSNSNKSISHVVFNRENEIVELLYKPKSDLCTTITFAPDGKTQQVITKSENSGEDYFIDKGSKKYTWIDQLRTSHAQRAVEKLARELSRVGLTEAEWLRLLAK
ncbi:MAG: response regulator receiver domain [Candidatus Poribacteria bacterium]|nr:response regulator receiver domain [Candidatus Poribacteria bacterium]